MDFPDPSRIAVIKPCCIGDCVMALPVVDALATTFPAAELEVFVGEHSASVFDRIPTVSRIVPIPNIPGWRDLPRLARRIKAGRYGLVVLLDRSRILRMAVHAAYSGPTIAIHDPVIGYRHEGDIYLDAIRQAGIEPAGTLPRIQLTRFDHEQAAAAASELGDPFVVVHPGGAMNPGSIMPGKRWSAGRFVTLIGWFRERGFTCALTGGPDERELCQHIVAQSGLPSAANVAGDLALMESVALIQRARLFLGPDTGISHLAAATGTPSVVIFGPTNPLRYGPRGACVRVVAPAASYEITDVDLRRSRTHVATVSTDKVSAEHVFEACNDLLSNAAWSGNCVD